MRESKTVIFFGPQGSGKGTQRKLLAGALERAGSSVLSFDAGAEFRSLLATDGFAQQRIKEIINKGNLFPHFLPTTLWGSLFINHLNEQTHLLVDGSPRTVQEAKLLEDAFVFFQRPVVDVIYLSLSEEEAIRRLTKRGRDDDTPDAIKERLGAFEQQTKPVLDFFPTADRYTVHQINGEGTVEEIHKHITDIVGISYE